MKIKRKTVIVLAVLYVIMNIFWGWLSTGLAVKGATSSPSYSIAQSKAKDCFLSDLTFSPNEVDWNGTKIEFNEVWLEKQTQLDYRISLVPFFWEIPIYKQKPGFNICFNLSSGYEAIDNDFVFFVIEEKGHSFAQRGTVLFWEEIDSLDWDSLVCKITNNWKFNGAKEIIITKDEK